MPSSPKHNVILSHKEAVAAVWRVRGNRTGVKHEKILWYQIREAFKDPKFYLTTLCSLVNGMYTAAISNFATTLFKSFDFDPLKSVLYQMPGSKGQVFYRKVCLLLVLMSS